MVERRAVESRLEPYYYLPSLVELENKIRDLAHGKLRNYIESIASGATPSVKEEEKFYSDEENGIPFIRVQNLSPTNELILNDLKYINLETHENYLKRSQVDENDLLVKITGVGRMAIASIAPKNFIGNTNQYLVVIKTKDLETSETLATFLNSDIAEKLASRRATGGTRPALDYTSLKSIPIVFKPETIEIMKKAVEAKRQKEAEAKALLESIDSYLLEKLGIVLPENKENPKVYYSKFSHLQGRRFDPFYHKKEFEILEKSISLSSYPKIKLKSILKLIESGSRPSGGVAHIEEGILSLGGEHVNTKCEIEVKNVKYIPVEFHLKNLKTETQEHDILLVKDGATTGKIGIITESDHIGQNINEHVFLLRFTEKANPFYILSLLNSLLYQKLISKIITGATVTGITKEVVRNLEVSLPSLEIQNEIAEHIKSIREQAKSLEVEAKELLEQAKAEVERMILGE